MARAASRSCSLGNLPRKPYPMKTSFSGQYSIEVKSISRTTPNLCKSSRNKGLESPFSPVKLILQEADDEQNPRKS